MWTWGGDGWSRGVSVAEKTAREEMKTLVLVSISGVVGGGDILQLVTSEMTVLLRRGQGRKAVEGGRMSFFSPDILL